MYARTTSCGYSHLTKLLLPWVTKKADSLAKAKPITLLLHVGVLKKSLTVQLSNILALDIKLTSAGSLSSTEAAYVKGSAQAGTRDNGASAFAKATQGKFVSAAVAGKTELSVHTEGSGSRALASNQGAAVSAGDSAAKIHTHRALSMSAVPASQMIEDGKKGGRLGSMSTALTRTNPSSNAIVSQPKGSLRRMVSTMSTAPRHLRNALVASRGDATALINSTGDAEATVTGTTGSARIRKNKNDFEIEATGTGQAGRTGNTMWALDGDNMAMAHLASSESGGIFCPCSMKQDARLCYCPCHGGESFNHKEPVNLNRQDSYSSPRSYASERY
ncbi:uncharacterized protein LY89DRAFT_726271 [Mollisia scopiformis]|uniref:Uncharacterized protein n=1 Tax=Mollisia scopiformis TaxID=149040 RepID=A0A132B3A2_MOLSC|nr:uncharacterized protein LY89DRAFT_726271 [Mollisia scopiformis]KUJ06870.1 hypothetical protein LY89DRAFT_726271 [Mollisia scopiformis]